MYVYRWLSFESGNGRPSTTETKKILQKQLLGLDQVSGGLYNALLSNPGFQEEPLVAGQCDLGLLVTTSFRPSSLHLLRVIAQPDCLPYCRPRRALLFPHTESCSAIFEEIMASTSRLPASSINHGQRRTAFRWTSSPSFCSHSIPSNWTLLILGPTSKKSSPDTPVGGCYVVTG
ncbi:hypothetical protein, variant [Cladophialophora immunda]|uniref:Uncharacterized protein n=1 Tax=Cladophialophora immunda TaxID=569365 RepID=A0A0D2CT12_9EURO|nr:uncharacterized protein PV07_06557 [Cladophialophora immunda]XP_016246965.1 hypothetical protein, variant [Cladophialophora immunda]KIW26748.1 hypothetical protein PV07_06557 [Cladophialophora immunda]KIW26749.1 hypothetical protein, variant [Cladophialophora immunda]